MELKFTNDEKKLYDEINLQCSQKVFCYSYVTELARKTKFSSDKVCKLLKKLENSGYIKTFCRSTPFCRHITVEAEFFASTQGNLVVEYNKPNDKDILEKVLEERSINTINTWIYLKVVTLLKNKKTMSLKEISDDIIKSKEGKHNWVNSLYLKNVMLDIQGLGFAQWEPIDQQNVIT